MTMLEALRSNSPGPIRGDDGGCFQSRRDSIPIAPVPSGEMMEDASNPGGIEFQ